MEELRVLGGGCILRGSMKGARPSGSGRFMLIALRFLDLAARGMTEVDGNVVSRLGDECLLTLDGLGRRSDEVVGAR